MAKQAQTMTSSIGTIFSSSTTTVFLILSLLAIPFILLRNLISIALTLHLFVPLSVHYSLPYISDDLTTFILKKQQSIQLVYLRFNFLGDFFPSKEGRFEHIKESSHFSCSLRYFLVYFTIIVFY